MPKRRAEKDRGEEAGSCTHKTQHTAASLSTFGSTAAVPDLEGVVRSAVVPTIAQMPNRLTSRQPWRSNVVGSTALLVVHASISGAPQWARER